MNDLVLDASAAGKLIRNEDHTQPLRSFLDQASDTGARFMAPPLFGVEVRNIAARTATQTSGTEKLYQLYQRAMELVETLNVDPANDHNIAVKQGITVQDAQYIELAIRQSALLVTYDKRQRVAAEKLGLTVCSPGLDRDP